MKITKELKQKITKEVAEKLVGYLSEQGEVVFIGFDKMKEAIKISARTNGIELDDNDDVMDELMDYVKAKLMTLRNGWDIYYPERTYIHKNNFIRTEANGLTVIKEA